MAPLLFLIVVEGMSKYILTAQNNGVFQGISFGNNIILSHVLFVDDIILVSDGSDRSLSTLYEVLLVFCKASGMIINEDKSSFYYSGMEESELISIQNIFSFNVDKIESGMKYLGFHLKPSRYLLKDWDWLISKVE